MMGAPVDNFYPRSPCGERRGHRWIECRHPLFLSTLSLRRATRQKLYAQRLFSDFYPRSPCGERPALKTIKALFDTISIHALLAESDQPRSRKTGRLPPFLSTLSLRRATTTLKSLTAYQKNFYPRSPCGERPQKRYHGSPAAGISIHALLAESDCWSPPACRCRVDFYPRSPCGERPHLIHARNFGHFISIHALLAESDPRYQNRDRAQSISIHALLAESD